MIRLFKKKDKEFVPLTAYTIKKKSSMPKISGFKRKYKLKKIAVIVLLCLIPILGGLFVKSDILKVKNIEIVSDTRRCIQDEHIKNELKVEGRFFFAVNTNSIEKELPQKFHCIKKVKAATKLPDRLVLTISERQPVVLTGVVRINQPVLQIDLNEATPSSGTAFFEELSKDTNDAVWFLADRDGYILTSLSEESFSLPRIFISTSDDLNAGKKLENGFIEKSLLIYEKLISWEMPIMMMRIKNNDLYIQANEKIIFSLEKDPMRQLASLQLILRKAKMDSKSIESIDLRFDKAVVIYPPQKKT